MESSRQQSAQLEKLEALGRAILNSPPDASTLPNLLEAHAPAMFTAGYLAIWLAPQRLLLKHPPEWSAQDLEPIQQWLDIQPQARVFSAKERLPWQVNPDSHRPVVVAPVLDVESRQATGGIYLELLGLGFSWNSAALGRLLPTVQSLAAQVASALHQAKIYAQTLERQKTLQELAFARRIQLSFLPKATPILPGWQFAANLEPAREVAGDFFNFIPLPGGGLGILIADVADKGVGPALYMALSHTLIRTFAVQYENQPEIVLGAANCRILQDAGETLFVTVFYGVLDPCTGVLTYANAGHNPPWLFRADGEVQLLSATGMPLGIEETACWKQGTVQLAPGETLMLYTDGATDAQNLAGEFFGQERLNRAAQGRLGLAASEMQTAILSDIRAHIGEAPQFDDITLIIARRES
jgi:serine phosphatase RsbU (regulator of sigma subunit)